MPSFIVKNMKDKIILDICNIALLKVNMGTIESLDATNEEANLAKIFYPISKEEVLQSYNWISALEEINFVKNEINEANTHNNKINNSDVNNDLSLIDQDNKLEKSKFGFNNIFLLPRNFLKLKEIKNCNSYLIVGKELYTNYSELNLIYIKNLEEEYLSNTLKNLISLNMAMKLADSFFILTKGISHMIKKEYEEQLKKAKQEEINNCSPSNFVDEDAITSWINARK